MKKMKNDFKWLVKIFIFTFILTIVFSVTSNFFAENLGVFLSLLVLILIIILGVIFDIIGVAISSSPFAPFTAMASRKKSGAKESIYILKNADKASNICNDILGDIAGIVSGALGFKIATRISFIYDINIAAIALIMASFIASLTVIGKALGKTYGINNSKEVVEVVGKVLYKLKFKKGS